MFDYCLVMRIDSEQSRKIYHPSTYAAIVAVTHGLYTRYLHTLWEKILVSWSTLGLKYHLHVLTECTAVGLQLTD